MAWAPALDHLLAKRQKLTRGHHAALPYPEIPAFMAKLGERPDISAVAIRFTILTAARSGEVYGARWSEIDLDAKVWTVPAERMKGAREHRVPLTDPTIAILTEMQETRRLFNEREFVFAGRRPGKPLSSMAMEMVLRRQKLEITVHGFRSSFRDWAGEATAFPRELAEAALAHLVGDETERAYRRGDALPEAPQTHGSLGKLLH